MDFGYGRVSKFEQNLELQIDAFLKEGINEKNIFLDKETRATDDRKNFKKVLDILRQGDVLIIWKLDRACGSLIQLEKLIKILEEKGASMRIITQPFIDTSDKNPFAKFVRNMFGLLAEFERDTIIERTKAGLASAKRRGKVLGAPKGLSSDNKKKAKLCAAHFTDGILTVDDICKDVGVSRGTYYKYIELEGLKGKKRKYKKTS